MKKWFNQLWLIYGGKMNMKNIIFAAAVIFVFFGCATLPWTKDAQAASLAGEIRLVNMNKEHSYLPKTVYFGIKIILRSTETDKRIEISSMSNGLFVKQNLKAGIYEILEVQYTAGSGSSNRTRLRQHQTWRYFTVENGKINNIGVIIWTIPEYGNWTTEYTRYYEPVKEKFLEKYTNVEWQDAEWVNREFPLYSQSREIIVFKNYVVNGDDEARYQDFWIYWHLLSNTPVGIYPEPLTNETLDDWVDRNIKLVANTSIDKISLIVRIGNEPDVEEIPLNLPGLRRTESQKDNTRLFCFGYNKPDDSSLGSRIIALPIGD
jgi:hypothetical protein